MHALQIAQVFIADTAWRVCNVQRQVPGQRLYPHDSWGFSPDVLQGQL